MTDNVDIVPPRIGDVVPRFSGRSTQGPIDLDTYRDQWVVLFAHPADFTPVCTSEFIALANAAREFGKMNCALLGISVDSLYSHLTWIGMIQEMSGARVEFPIIEDPTMEIARAYGMIGAEARDAATVRATYFIGPGSVLRASTVYPPDVGRSIPEMLRLLAALQKADSGDFLVPANWQPGDNLLLPPGETVDEALMSGGAASWYYRSVNDGAASG